MTFSHFSFSTPFPVLAQKKIPKLCKAKLSDNESTSNAKKWSAINHQDQITDEMYTSHILKLKEVRNIFSKAIGDSLESLVMVDDLQRLGIDYRFQDEIQEFTTSQFIAFGDFGGRHRSLHESTLQFRLLRQEGYYVPADVFNNFKDDAGKLEPNVVKDVKGLMGLYEASQLSTVGEDILDEAGDFSYRILSAWMRHLDHHQAKIVANSLRNPYHRSLARFMVKSFINDYSGTNTYMNAFMELAKMDFNIVQSMHQKEIIQVSKWWEDLGLAKELKFARDQPIKWYIWAMTTLPDPGLSEQRVEFTKPISLIYVIDDIFDVRGTLAELTLFTEAVNRWDLAAIDQLADDMKICFTALYDITDEFSHKVYQKHGWNPIDSLQKAWARLCNAFLLEAEWLATGSSPKAEEYLENAILTSGVHVALVHAFFLMDHGITKREVDVLDNSIPGIVSSTATIVRLFDDLGSAKDENQDGRDGSYVDFYIKEHLGTSIQGAREHVLQMISDTWKRLNHEFLSPNPFSPCFNKVCLNVARTAPMMYSYDEDQNLPVLEEQIKSMLFESFII